MADLHSWHAPVRDLLFAMEHMAGAGTLEGLPAFADFSMAFAASVLEEGGKFASGVLAPLNRNGDRHGAQLENGVVTTAPGFREAYGQFVHAGWNSIAADPAHGGQGQPLVLALALQELWQSACMSLGLCPLLTQGAIEALSAHGTPAQKATYLPKLITGEWTGTMNLTEPEAGSDVGALKTRAARAGDGTYRITGTKIFITWGEHDCAENIVHLVLARLPDAPPGTRGISLFLVPKFLVNEDGALGARNRLSAASLEHKLGIHGSPTCVMQFEEATGFLIGQENRGMACMFTMMNAARLNVGMQGVAIGERSLQQALAYAMERRQGKPFGLQHEMREMLPIVQHPDVRRMILTMRSRTEASRAICLATALAMDLARHHPDAAERGRQRAREELLTPIAKAWSTDGGFATASLGVQVHGGMGFVEETGAAQHLRDARILPIYEGTNGIQAIDLVTRKLALADGGALSQLMDEMKETAQQLGRTQALKQWQAPFAAALDGFAASARFLTEKLKEGHPGDALAGATPFLDLAGHMVGAHFLARGALAAESILSAGTGNQAFLSAKIVSAEFFITQLLPVAAAQASAIFSGADVLFRATPDALGPI
ncbi:MAG TPA: acyl-CoA dehydrogenase [Micropepsaceae bacterium]|nr:acyl-CoA dehydrogenase [Micropepsaceae bacterium]